jgi:hypothetical protein
MSRANRTFITGLLLIAVGSLVTYIQFVDMVSGEFNWYYQWLAMIGGVLLFEKGCNKVSKTID